MKLIRYTTTPDLRTWSPFYRLSPWQDFLDTALDLSGNRAPAWNPALDVHENEQAVTVTLEVAGMKKEDFEISLQEDTLTIGGRRELQKPEATSESIRNERSSGEFLRTITLPCAVKTNEVEAGYKDGLLTVTLPKAEEWRPRKIEVKLN
jgi:HSP20 family protein